jgi:hypothetical protein
MRWVLTGTVLAMALTACNTPPNKAGKPYRAQACTEKATTQAERNECAWERAGRAAR